MATTIEDLYPHVRTGDATKQQLDRYVKLLIQQTDTLIISWWHDIEKRVKGSEPQWTGKAAQEALTIAIEKAKTGEDWHNQFLPDLEQEMKARLADAERLFLIAEEKKRIARPGIPGMPGVNERREVAAKAVAEYEKAHERADMLETWYMLLADVPTTLYGISQGNRPASTYIRHLITVYLQFFFGELAMHPAYAAYHRRFLDNVEAWETGEKRVPMYRKKAYKYPEYMVRTTDKATKVIMDYDNPAHQQLYAGTEENEARFLLPLGDRKSTVVEVKDIQPGNLPKEIPPWSVPMYMTLITLIDDAIRNEQKAPFSWTLEYVVKCWKNGGTVTPGTRVVITEQDELAAREHIERLGSVVVELTWKAKNSNGKIQVKEAAGQLIAWEIETDDAGEKIFTLLSIPPLLRYATHLGMIERTEAVKVAVFSPLGGKRHAINRSQKNLALEQYLRSRIGDMKRQGKRQRANETDNHYAARWTILYESAWNHCRDTRKPLDEWADWQELSKIDRKRFRDLVSAILDGYKEQGYIEGYTLKKVKGAYEKVVISPVCNKRA